MQVFEDKVFSFRWVDRLARAKGRGACGGGEQEAKQDQEREVVSTRGGQAWDIRELWVVSISRRVSASDREVRHRECVGCERSAKKSGYMAFHVSAGRGLLKPFA